MQKQAQYLPNLNSVRAIAALMVVLCHIELRKKSYLYQVKPLLAFGTIGVSIFFILSGFLITYLLLTEKETKGNINIKDFYIRRILRIWPLYFLILFFGYFCMPFFFPTYYSRLAEHFSMTGLLLNALFLTNVTFLLKITPVVISAIWSIGIEEQFYLFWPWIVKSTKSQAITYVVAVFAAIPVLKIATMALLFFLKSPLLKDISIIISTSRFDLMAAGGFCAYIGYYKTIKICRVVIDQAFIQTKKVQLISLAGFFCCVVLICGNIQPELILSFMAIFTAILLSNLALNKNVIIHLENKLFNYLGKISYGIYLWHLPVIFLANHYIYRVFPVQQPFAQNIVIYLSALIFTIIFATISYYLLEKPFLNLKHKFAHTN